MAHGQDGIDHLLSLIDIPTIERRVKLRDLLPKFSCLEELVINYINAAEN